MLCADVIELTGRAAELLVLPDFTRAGVRVLRPARPAVVLGSGQSLSVVADPPSGVDVVQRRTGGGAVWVDDTIVWMDVIVPRGHQRWDDDVARATFWIGQIWAELLGGDVHHGPLVKTSWSRSVCFGGLGPGEVTVGGRKVVGVSQRRTRDGALFQCGVLLHWDPSALCAALALPAEAEAQLANVATGTTVSVIEAGAARLTSELAT